MSLFLALPLAAVISVGNFSHVDTASGTAIAVIDGKQMAADRPAYSILITIFTWKIVTQADTPTQTAETEAVPTHGLFLGRNAISTSSLAAIRRAAVPEDTLAKRMSTLNN
jgi:hypothetical protein